MTVNKGATVRYEAGVTQTTTGYLINNGAIVATSALQNLRSDDATATVTGTNLTLDNTLTTTYKGIVNATTLTKTGTGSLSLSGTSNNITGLVTVEAGKLVMSMALGKSAHIAENGTLFIYMSQGTGATTNTLTVTGSGRLDASGACWFQNPAGWNDFAGDIYVTGGTFGVRGTFDADCTIRLAGGALRNCEGNGEYTCNVVLDHATTADVMAGWGGKSVTLSGIVSNGVGNTLRIRSDSNLDSMVVLTNPNNTYTNTNILNGAKGGRLRITNSGALGTGIVTVAEAAYADPTKERTYLDLNGCDFVSSRLAGAGEVTNMNAGTTTQITLDSATLTNAYTGNIRFVKNAGTTTLSTAYAYTGGTEVAGGVLKLTETAALGTGGLTLTDGTLELGTGTYDLGDITGGNGMFAQGGGVSFQEIRDGSSNTVLMGEKYLNPTNYTTGADNGDNEGIFMGHDKDICRFAGSLPYQDRADYAAITNYGSAHSGGFNATFADGSTRRISYSVDLTNFKNLCNRKDGKVVTLE